MNNTKINLTYNGTPYTLEYNRASVKLLEDNGFNLSEFSSKPLNNIEMVFTGAFIKNHRRTSQATIDAIYRGCKDKDELITTLITMINETYNSLMDESASDEGNVSWEAVGGTTPTIKVNK